MTTLATLTETALASLFATAFALGLIILVLLVVHAIDWYRRASRARLLYRDPSLIGVDQIRLERLARVQALQAPRKTNGSDASRVVPITHRRLS